LVFEMYQKTRIALRGDVLTTEVRMEARTRNLSSRPARHARTLACSADELLA
jgi:hypothetical protein